MGTRVHLSRATNNPSKSRRLATPGLGLHKVLFPVGLAVKILKPLLPSFFLSCYMPYPTESSRFNDPN